MKTNSIITNAVWGILFLANLLPAAETQPSELCIPLPPGYIHVQGDSLQISPDGKTAAIMYEGESVRGGRAPVLVDLKTGKCTKMVDCVPDANGGEWMIFSFSPDSSKLQASLARQVENGFSGGQLYWIDLKGFKAHKIDGALNCPAAWLDNDRIAFTSAIEKRFLPTQVYCLSNGVTTPMKTTAFVIEGDMKSKKFLALFDPNAKDGISFEMIQNTRAVLLDANANTLRDIGTSRILGGWPILSPSFMMLCVAPDRGQKPTTSPASVIWTVIDLQTGRESKIEGPPNGFPTTVLDDGTLVIIQRESDSYVPKLYRRDGKVTDLGIKIRTMTVTEDTLYYVTADPKPVLRSMPLPMAK